MEYNYIMRKTYLDLIGTKYGRYTIEDIVYTKKYTRTHIRKDGTKSTSNVPCVKCKCDCGNIKIFPAERIRDNSAAKSCGGKNCIYSIRNRKYILKGTKFGNLTVIKFAYIKYEMTHYKCKCTCGNTETIRRQWLQDGSKTECLECTALNKYEYIPDVGDKINNVEIIKINDNIFHGSNTSLVCKCPYCYNFFETIYSTLKLKAKRKSCGCTYKEEHGKRLAKLNYKHGKSKTKGYIEFNNNLRREKSLSLDTEWTFDMELALRRFQKSCVNCGSKKHLSVDHVYPLSKGFGLKPGNACILCKQCNSSKNAKLPEELDEEFKNNVLISAAKFKKEWDLHNKP